MNAQPSARIALPAFAAATPMRTVALVSLLALGHAANGDEVPHAFTADPWAICGPPPYETLPDEADQPPGATPTELFGDRLEGRFDDRLTLSGDAVVIQPGRELEADWLSYDMAEQEVAAEGNLLFRDPVFYLEAERGVFRMDTDQGWVEQSRYWYEPRHARGDAERVTRHDPDRMTLDWASYTTCNPGDRFWRLQAREVNLNRETGMGDARHVTLRIHDVPLLYTPYINFPITDERKTGFLYPRLGTGSDTGFEFLLPFYWNIAPHRDATLTPRWMSQRGLQLQTEARYLNPRSSGEVYVEVLPDDRAYGDDRVHATLDQRARPGRHWRTRLNLNYVSDPEYFDELGTSPEVSAATHLPQLAEAQYNSWWGTFRTRAQGFQTIDPTIPEQNRPYQRLPQLLLEAELPDRGPGLDLVLDAEAVNFERDDRDTGIRLDLYPRVSRPLRTPSAFLEPTLGVRHTQYQMDFADPDDPRDDTLTRTLPVASLDTGLVFERRLAFADRSLIQTLEPRLYYLYVPFRDQTELPRFDTGRLDFSFPAMFRDDRFVGADRVGDANQLTAAVTTRFLDGLDGRQYAAASLGQIFYFDDRRVQLQETAPEETAPEETARSHIVAQASAGLPTGLGADATIQWDPDEERTHLLALQGRYRGEGTTANIGYRYRRDRLEQGEISAAVPIFRHWRIVGRWLYSLREERNDDSFLGLEYESCCWAVRTVWRRYYRPTLDTEDSAIYFQLELKGLAGFGSPVEQFLGRGILGYDDERAERSPDY